MLAKRRRFRLISVVAALFMVLTASASAYASNEKLIFASAKEMLLYQIRNAAPADMTLSTSTITLAVEELKGEALAELAPLEGASLTVTSTSDLKKRLLQLGVSTVWQGKSMAGGVYVGEKSLVVDAAEFQPILAPLIGPMAGRDLPPLPKYLVVDVPEVTDSLAEMWQIVDQSTAQSAELYQSKSVRELTAMVVEAIPDQYIRRSGVNGVTIAFNHDGLVDIARSMVSYGYDHQTEVADVVAALAAEHPELQVGDPAEIRAGILKSFASTTKEQALAEVKRALLTDSLVRIGYTRLTMTKELFGPVTFKLSGSVTVADNTGSMTLRYTVDSTTGTPVTVTFPQLDDFNSMGIEQWLFQSLGDPFADLQRR